MIAIIFFLQWKVNCYFVFSNFILQFYNCLEGYNSQTPRELFQQIESISSSSGPNLRRTACFDLYSLYHGGTNGRRVPGLDNVHFCLNNAPKENTWFLFSGQEMFERIDKEEDGEVYLREVVDFLAVLDNNIEQSHQVRLD